MNRLLIDTNAGLQGRYTVRTPLTAWLVCAICCSTSKSPPVRNPLTMNAAADLPGGVDSQAAERDDLDDGM